MGGLRLLIERNTRKDGYTVLKKLFAMTLVVGVLGLTTGCPAKKDDKKTGTKTTGTKTGGGGTGTATGTATGTSTGGAAEKALAIDGDLAAVTVEQGGEAKVTVKIKRTGFDEDVTVKFDDLPEGVTAEGDKIEKGKSEGEFKLKAKADAKEAKDAKVKVTVSGGGKDANGEAKVTVKKKKG